MARQTMVPQEGLPLQNVAERRMKLDGKTTEELIILRRSIEADPDNKMPPGSLWLYKPKIRKKLDEIDRAIADTIRAKRIARGEPVNDAGYSGRKSNRR